MNNTYRGPRTVVTARVSTETVLLLETAAAQQDITRSALLTRLIEKWGNEWYRANIGQATHHG